ncbi:hypothetical protein H6P81_002628 [Aristolochia fimbriata]|uniref:Uncharacterized protein n=1 Tax=Aristolochia fimbriata TaxID=158543 RepID=A0AAV7FAA6_ARIFI|nr:hypothetical protein H6P81_002628 [Aristolochia fimbriata]
MDPGQMTGQVDRGQRMWGRGQRTGQRTGAVDSGDLRRRFGDLRQTREAKVAGCKQYGRKLEESDELVKVFASLQIATAQKDLSLMKTNRQEGLRSTVIGALQRIR